MRKLFLLAIVTGISVVARAQSASVHSFAKKGIVNDGIFINRDGLCAKTNGTFHDTIVLSNITAADTATNYYISKTGHATDSGFLGGTNCFGYSGFAER